jgi:DNA repair exonuclease SbcCD ATPase subunit
MSELIPGMNEIVSHVEKQGDRIKELEDLLNKYESKINFFQEEVQQIANGSSTALIANGETNKILRKQNHQLKAIIERFQENEKNYKIQIEELIVENNRLKEYVSLEEQSDEDTSKEKI